MSNQYARRQSMGCQKVLVLLLKHTTNMCIDKLVKGKRVDDEVFVSVENEVEMKQLSEACCQCLVARQEQVTQAPNFLEDEDHIKS